MDNNTENSPYSAPSTAQTIAPGVQAKMSLKDMLFSLQGRISRRQFWMIYLYILGGCVVLGIVIALLTAILGEAGAIIASILTFLMYIPLIWISLAMQAKRWHDRDKSAWWILIGFIPFIGGIWALVECGFLPGTAGPNSFGDDPVIAQ